MQIRRLLIQTMVGLCLVGCGYQVAHQAPLQGVMVKINGPAVDAAVREILQRGFSAGDGGEGDAHRAVLLVHEETYQKWPIAAAAFDASVQFEVKFQWVFSLTNPAGETLIDRERITLTEYFGRDNQALLAAHEAEQVLQKQLRDQAMMQLRFRLEAALDSPERK